MRETETRAETPSPLRTRTIATPVIVPRELSTREMQVLELIARGRSNGDIATTLQISIHTVKVRVARILTKLSARNRRGAALEAARRGLLPETSE